MKQVWSFAVAALWLAASTGTAQPRLAVQEGAQFDLGKVFRGTQVERTLTLKNTGTDTLIIEHVNTSCGCTGTILKNNRIPPGGTTPLQIKFDSKNFTGNVHKSVGVYSNGGEGGLTRIEFTASVFEEIGIEPQTIMFTDAEVSRKSETKLTVTNNGATPLLLTGYRSTLKELTVTLPHEAIPPGGSSTLPVVFSPTAKMPVFSEGVFITTNNEHMPEVYIKVFGSAKEFKFE
jgi:hypothetical protein